MQPHFYTTLLLAFTIQLDYVILSTDAEGKLPQSVLKLSAAVISVKGSVKLRCSRPDSSPASRCTFTFNQRKLSGSDCERSFTGAELLSGSHSALNNITLRCVHSPEGGEKPPIDSNPSTVTVLDLMKPSISVSTDLTNAHIRCEAPPGIIGAYFFLFEGKEDILRGTVAKEQRAVNFTVPHSSDSNLTYCCRYQFKSFNSDLSDCVDTKNKDQSGSSTDETRFLWRHILSGLVLLATIGLLLEHFISHKPTTDAPGRKKRWCENAGQSETNC